MSCGIKFRLELVNTKTKSVVWSSNEEFKHDSDLCEACMASDLGYALIDSCEDEKSNLGKILIYGSIDENSFYRVHGVAQSIVDSIKSSASNIKVRVKKVACMCGDNNIVSDNYFVYKSCVSNLYFYVKDDQNYNTSVSGLTENEKKVFELKEQILAAGYENSDLPPLISPSTIALILLDELNRRDGWDTLQELQGNFPLIVDREQTYGLSQMSPDTLGDLIDKGNYPSVSGYEGDTDGFFEKRSLYLEIMEEKNSPKLIASFMKTAINYWMKGTRGNLSSGKNAVDPGFDISEMPHILATLYAMGYAREVHDNPGGLRGRWDNPSSVKSMLSTINNKMGIPDAPARFLDLSTLNLSGSQDLKCVEYVGRVNAAVDVGATSEFTDSRGRKSKYLASYSVVSSSFRRTQFMCDMC